MSPTLTPPTRTIITQALIAAGFRDVSWPRADSVQTAVRKRPTIRSVIEATGAYVPCCGIAHRHCFAQAWVSRSERRALPP